MASKGGIYLEGVSVGFRKKQQKQLQSLDLMDLRGHGCREESQQISWEGGPTFDLPVSDRARTQQGAERGQVHVGQQGRRQLPDEKLQQSGSVHRPNFRPVKDAPAPVQLPAQVLQEDRGETEEVGWD